MFKGLFSKISKTQDSKEKAEIKHVQWEDNEKQSKKGDPLNDLHEDGGLQNIGRELTEDDLLLLERDPDYIEKMKFNLEEIAAEQNFESFQASSISEDLYEEWKDDERVSPLDKKAEVPFDEQDLSQQWAPKEKAKTLKESTAERGEFSKEEFHIMEECANYLYETFKRNNKNYPRPVFGNGKQMSKESIWELRNEYFDFKKKNPKEFAEMKVAMGDWKKRIMVWEKKQPRKGEWISYGKSEVLVSSQNPEHFLNDNGSSYYSTGKSFTTKNKVRITPIRLQMPIQNKTEQK